MAVKEKLLEKGVNLDDLSERERVLIDIIEELLTTKSTQPEQPQVNEQEVREEPKTREHVDYGNVYDRYNPNPYMYGQPYYNPMQPPPAQQATNVQYQSVLDKYAEDPYIGEFVKGLKKELDVLRTLTGVTLNDYINFKRQAVQMANDLEFRRIQRERFSKDKEKYKFLKEPTRDELVAIAQQRGINTWDGAYDAWLADKIRQHWDNHVKEMEEEIRKKVVSSQPPVTEISSGAVTTMQSGNNNVDYESSWKILEKELNKFPI